MNPYYELLVFLTTSAAGLRKEPAIYGPLRLIDAAAQLAAILEKQNPKQVEILHQFIQVVEEQKNSCMTDENGFYEMLDYASSMLVDLI